MDRAIWAKNIGRAIRQKFCIQGKLVWFDPGNLVARWLSMEANFIHEDRLLRNALKDFGRSAFAAYAALKGRSSTTGPITRLPQ